MKISTKGRYGIRALIDLVINSECGSVTLKAISERQEISERYLEQIFSLLRKSGLIIGRKGAQGGYTLSKTPNEITVGEILRALEGESLLIDINDEDSNDMDFQIRHDQLQIDGLDVAQRIHGDIEAGIGHHMHDVLVVKAADNVHDGIGLADVGEELVAETCALAGALHQTGDVHEFDDSGGLLVRLVHFGQLLQPLIGNGHRAHVGVDGAEGIVCAFCAGVGDGVEQGALAHVGQTHDT